jgi:hypothetical protein
VFEALGCMPAITLALAAGTDKAARASLPERAARSARKNGRATLPSRHVARDARTVIHEIDESLRRLVLRDAVNGSGVELSFEAPTKEWASRRNTPTINIYLYDIREDVQQREVEYEEIRDEEGRVVERRPPPRRYTLSYLVTVWTQRPEDEHQVLSSLLAAFLQFDRLPQDVLSETLAAQPYAVRTTVALPPPRDRTLADLGYPIPYTCALPPPEDRALSDVWSALGGELKPSLDLIVTVPFDAGRVLGAGPPVLRQPEIVAVDTTDAGARDTVGGREPVGTGAA